jgi:hypothetical protein
LSELKVIAGTTTGGPVSPASANATTTFTRDNRPPPFLHSREGRFELVWRTTGKGGGGDGEAAEEERGTALGWKLTFSTSLFLHFPFQVQILI